MIFDLFTDRLVHKYIVPNDQTLNGRASLVTPIVEVGHRCENTYVYIADVAEHGLVIYNLQEDRSFRINNTRGNAFGADADAMNMTIAGESFDLTDGTLGMSLSPPGFFKHRYNNHQFNQILQFASFTLSPLFLSPSLSYLLFFYFFIFYYYLVYMTHIHRFSNFNEKCIPLLYLCVV